jgi:hypothetical protein
VPSFDSASFDSASFDSASFDSASFDSASFDSASLRSGRTAGPWSGRTERATLLLLVCLSACGYGFAAGAGRLPSGAERVFVRPLEDHTTDAELGALVAAALRGELARRGADAGPGARARIEGAVEESSFGPSSPNGATWRAVLVVSARLVIDGKVALEQRARREEDWLAGQDPLESEGRRRLALRRAAGAVARDIVERFERP